MMCLQAISGREPGPALPEGTVLSAVNWSLTGISGIGHDKKLNRCLFLYIPELAEAYSHIVMPVYFIDRYATHPVFDLFGMPLVIWSGSWKFSAEEIQSVAESKRERVLILATEKNVAGYQRLAGLVDGNAYYWSSVNPATHPGYADKLVAMGEAVHNQGGVWIAPAAAGFDARLVGGTSVVERLDGETLRIEMATALQSAPDAIGLISWNEFSENSHIEPSQAFGNRYLQVLTEVRNASTPKVSDFDSSAPAGINLDNTSRFTALFLLGVLITISLLIIVIRANRMDKRKV